LTSSALRRVVSPEINGNLSAPNFFLKKTARACALLSARARHELRRWRHVSRPRARARIRFRRARCSVSLGARGLARDRGPRVSAGVAASAAAAAEAAVAAATCALIAQRQLGDSPLDDDSAYLVVDDQLKSARLAALLGGADDALVAAAAHRGLVTVAHMTFPASGTIPGARALTALVSAAARCGCVAAFACVQSDVSATLRPSTLAVNGGLARAWARARVPRGRSMSAGSARRVGGRSRYLAARRNVRR
jgi:hypothetical protein